MGRVKDLAIMKEEQEPCYIENGGGILLTEFWSKISKDTPECNTICF